MSEGGKYKTSLLLIAIVLLLLATGCPPAKAGAAEADLQAQIDRTAEGQTLHIAAGTYEGPLRIDRPIHLIADGEVVLVRTDERPALTVATNGSTIAGLTLVDRQEQAKEAVLLVTGSENKLQDITVQAANIGVQLKQAHNNKLINITVRSNLPQSTGTKTKKRGNGIDLRESNGNLITGCLIERMFDGYYIENSEATHLENNQVHDSRYGFHLMYSKNSQLVANKGERNVTGAMMMTSSGIHAVDNRFAKQAESVNSQGILLYDVADSQIQGNVLEGNRVGMYVEFAKNNEIAGNTLNGNFIGIQLKNAQDNKIYRNDFFSNVIQAQAKDSVNNELNGNFWDSFRGIDLKGTGTSAISYQINPLFFTLTDATPPFQLFFHAPGLLFLEELLKGKAEQTLIDIAPLMQPDHSPAVNSADRQAQTNTGTLVLGLLLLLASTSLLYFMGVRKQ